MSVKRFFDWSEFTTHGSMLELSHNAVRKGLEYDAYGNQTTFKAIALTDAHPLNPAAVRALAAEPAGDDSDTSLSTTNFIFKGRILGENSPHAFLPDPCNPDQDSDPARQMSIIKMHTSFVSNADSEQNDESMVKMGDIVWVELKKNVFSYDLQFGTFIKKSRSAALIANEEVEDKTCDPLSNLDFETEGSPMVTFTAAAPIAAAQILALAQDYESDGTLPNKSQHRDFLSTLHPEMVPNVKAFIYFVWASMKTTIQINSAYRSPAAQQRLIDAWEAESSATRGPRPAQAGTSYHNFGMAFDFNPTLEDGTQLGPSDPPQSWRQIVAAGEKVNLYWGGRFSTNYDPIHFDFRNVVPSSSKARLLAMSEQQGVAANRVDISNVV